MPHRSPRRAARPSGLAGSNPVFLDACDTARAEADAGRPVVITGERGVGKLAVAREILQDHGPAAVLDAAETDDADGWLCQGQLAPPCQSKSAPPEQVAGVNSPNCLGDPQALVDAVAYGSSVRHRRMQL